MQEMLRMENIHKAFGSPLASGSPPASSSRFALKGVSLTLWEGEVLAVIGPSGSGKSTLLRCAALLERADRGGIAYLGRAAATDSGPFTRYEKSEVLRQCRASFGMVFQSFELFPHWNVMRNLTDAPICVLKKSPREAQETARALLARVGLGDRENAYPYQLSGGEKQRVCIARALCMGPRMLFFDEPTSALDPEMTREILDVIRGLRRDGMTMLLVTHEMAFARGAADRVLFLDGGVPIEEGPADDLMEHPQNPRTRAFLTQGL